jgi:hypothetical protein
MGYLNRRSFVRNAAVAALCAPFLELLDPSRARGATPNRAKYLLIFYTNGTDTALWSPKGSSESSITFSPMTELLAPVKDQITIVEKLDSFGTAASHGAPGGLCGANYGANPLLSIDQFISDGLKANGIKTQIANLVLGCTAEASQHTTFYRANTALTPIVSPVAAYQAIFGNLGSGTPPSTGTGGMATAPPDTAVADAAARLKRRQSCLSVAKSELTDLRNTLGGAERQKLELHLDSIAQLEDRLAQSVPSGTGGGGGQSGGGGVVMPTAGCKAPAKPALADHAFGNSVLHLDLAINAFACDLTRVASVQFGHHQQCAVKLPDAMGDYHNDFMHSDQPPHTRLQKVERWLCQQFVDAVNKLKSHQAPDGSGTLLDQTLICWARDMADGPNHTGDDMRFVFAGGAGGYLKKSPNGRYIQGGGQSHQRALLNMAEAMGITNLGSFGDMAQSHVPLTNISV